MKKILTYIILGLAVSLSVFTSCTKKESHVIIVPDKPMINKDVFVDVSVNTVNFTYTGDAPYWIWVVSNGVNITKKTATLDVPVKGNYSVKLGVAHGGDLVYSDDIPFEIERSDLNFLEGDFYKQVTGGLYATKTWKVDVNRETHKMYYHHCAVDFYGDTEAGGSEDNIWGPWGGYNLYDWGNAPEDGKITFNGGNELECTLTLDGVEYKGNFTLSAVDRDPNFLTLSSGQSLWENMTTGVYGELNNNEYGGLSPKVGYISFMNNDNLRFPLETGGISGKQFVPSDLTTNVMIMHCSDSSMIVRIKRTYAANSTNFDKCWLTYNFIVDGYHYPSDVPPVEPINTEFDPATIVGEWYFENPPYDWISWKSSEAMNNWADSTAVKETGWATLNPGWSNQKFTFNDDGTCDINGLATTYSIESGVITFGDAVSIAPGTVSLDNMTSVNILSVKNSTNGIWLGVQNDGKEEDKAVHFVQKPKAGLTFADAANWSFQYWGGGAGDCFVTKDGTYTIYLEGAMAATTSLVFCIDIKGLFKHLSEGYQVTVDGIYLDNSETSIAYDPSKIVVGDLEDNGNLRIEIVNAWGSTASDPAINLADIHFDSKLAVTFTLSNSGINL